MVERGRKSALPHLGPDEGREPIGAAPGSNSPAARASAPLPYTPPTAGWLFCQCRPGEFASFMNSTNARTTGASSRRPGKTRLTSTAGASRSGKSWVKRPASISGAAR